MALASGGTNMSSIGISVINFILAFGGALVGMFIGGRLSERQLNADTKDVVRVGMGLVGTIVAIALGLLISSAFSYRSNQADELIQVSADVASLGPLLQRYGPEAKWGPRIAAKGC
jgi:hypothetical protein